MTTKPLPQPTTPLIRLSFFFTRRPSWSTEEFNSYWRHKHGALVVASNIFHDTYCQNYTQIHPDPALKKQATDMGLSVNETDWDGCSEMYFRNFEDYERFAKSDEMRDVLGPDGDHFLQSENIRAAVATVDPIWNKL